MQGHNSMRQIALMLDRLTERIGHERDVRVVHTDLPHCDFTSLFVTLEASPDTYRRGRPYAFASAIGHSFYDRLLPAGSLTLGWSSFALHWMGTSSGGPTRAHLAGPRLFGGGQGVGGGRRGGLEGFPGASCRGTHAWRSTGSGGWAVDAIGATRLEPMMDLANDILQALVAEGKLGAQAYATMTIPSRPRSREEFTAPFDTGDISRVVAGRAGHR